MACLPVSDEIVRVEGREVRSDHNQCSICLEELVDKVRVLACDHIFHKNCIEKWLIINNSCSTCS